jgi:hypothetical protein
MFLVGGGILVHGIPSVAEALHHVEELAHGLAVAGNFAAVLATVVFNGLFGFLAGGLLAASNGCCPENYRNPAPDPAPVTGAGTITIRCLVQTTPYR